jgi:chain length determinant protein EpsF
MNANKVLVVLRLRWWLILTIFVATVVGAFGATYVMPKRYQATTTLLLDVRTDPLVSALAPTLAHPAYIATQTEVIRSERVAGRVVKMLGLAQSPEAVAEWREATEGRVPLEVYYGEALSNGLSIDPGRGSSVLTLTYVAGDPKFAAAAANAFAQAYLDLSVELRVGPAREYASFFDERLKSLRADLEAAQARVSDFNKNKGIVLTPERVDIETARLTSLESALAAAVAESAETASRQRNSGTETSADVQASAAVQSLKSELARAQTRLNEISTTYGPNHPTHIQLNAQIAELKQQLANEMRRVSGTTVTVNRMAGQKISELRSLLEAQKRVVLALRADRDESALLVRDLETAQRAYEQVAQRRAQLANESQSEQAPARVLSPATEPLAPASPNMKKNIAVGLLLGLVLGIGVALAWEAFDQRVRSEQDMHMVEGVPLLGVMSSRPGPPTVARRLPSANRPPSLPRITLEPGSS